MSACCRCPTWILFWCREYFQSNGPWPNGIKLDYYILFSHSHSLEKELEISNIDAQETGHLRFGISVTPHHRLKLIGATSTSTTLFLVFLHRLRTKYANHIPFYPFMFLDLVLTKKPFLNRNFSLLWPPLKLFCCGSTHNKHIHCVLSSSYVAISFGNSSLHSSARLSNWDRSKLFPPLCPSFRLTAIRQTPRTPSPVTDCSLNFRFLQSLFPSDRILSCRLSRLLRVNLSDSLHRQ